MITEAVDRFGTINIAVNNAGIEGTPLSKTADYEESVWDEVIAVNLKGVWLCMKYEIPVMQKFGRGVIVNISSLAGLKGGDAGVAYHASKFGVVGATKAAAPEYAADKIRINAVCPAVIETPMAERAFTDPDRRANAEKMHRVGRFGKVSEVVGYCCLVSVEGFGLYHGDRYSSGWWCQLLMITSACPRLLQSLIEKDLNDMTRIITNFPVVPLILVFLLPSWFGYGQHLYQQPKPLINQDELEKIIGPISTNALAEDIHVLWVYGYDEHHIAGAHDYVKGERPDGWLTEASASGYH